jgi:hypothetical protein
VEKDGWKTVDGKIA